MILFSAGRQGVTSGRNQEPAYLYRKTSAAFGAEVYRTSTDDPALGKSSGKESACCRMSSEELHHAERSSLRSQLNCSRLKQINQHALNATAPHANALIY